MIKTLVRKKELDVAVQQQELGRLRSQREAGARALQRCQTRVEQARCELLAQLAADQELVPYHLEYARANEVRRREQLTALQEKIREEDSAIGRLEHKIQHAQKQIEKLGVVIEERERETRAEQQCTEWLQLDEWVVGHWEMPQ